MKALIAIATIVLALANTLQARDINYVVIGAFSIRENAAQFAEKVKGEYDINPVKHLFYVFIMKTDDHAKALEEVVRLRQQGVYKDAWVFLGTLGEGGEGIDITEPSVPGPEERKNETKEEGLKEAAPIATTTVPVTSVSSARDPEAKTKEFFFKVINDDGVQLSGAEITVVDPKSQRKELVLEGNKNVTMKPINQSGDMRLECDLAGYRKIVQTINFKDPTTTDGIKVVDDRIVVPFHLVRLQTGDFAILYNVFFYKDAAIMRPESKFDLDGLLTMMQENPKYRIRIHGHTNGNAAGPILEASESGSIFSLSGAKQSGGSAKKLSEKRAAVIRTYLMQNGIDPKRMEIKAWGGKKPIYDIHHTQASANVRVEVEVLED